MRARSGDRFGKSSRENEGDGLSVWRAEEGGQRGEREIIAEKKIKVEMCPRFTKKQKRGKRRKGFPDALLRRDGLSTTPKETAIAIRELNENVNPSVPTHPPPTSTPSPFVRTR